MNRCKILITQALLLSSAGMISTHIYSLNISRIALGSISALGGSVAGGALYGHIILPWVGNQRVEEEKKRTAENHAKEQEKWRAFYRTLNTKYNAATTPMETSKTLCEYKNQLIADLAGLEKAIEFDWDDKAEKDALIKRFTILKRP